jgi:hypothetical protein
MVVAGARQHASRQRLRGEGLLAQELCTHAGWTDQKERLIVKKTTKSKNPNSAKEILRELPRAANRHVEGGQDIPLPQPDRAHIITGG